MAFERKKKKEAARWEARPTGEPPPPAGLALDAETAALPAGALPPVAVVQLTNELKRQLDRGEAALAVIERIGRFEHATFSELKGVFAELRKLA